MPKGDEDIILLYDLMALGLNDAYWDSKFCIPLVDNVLDVTTNLSWFGDIDAAEMFHNYNIPVSLQPYAGVDVSWAEKGD